MYPFKSLVYLCGFTFYIFVEGSIMQVVPKRTDRNCYDRRYFTSVVRGIGIKFSISNNSTSLFGHWLKYCHCASMPFITISLIFKSKWTIQWCIYSQECYSSFILWIFVETITKNVFHQILFFHQENSIWLNISSNSNPISVVVQFHIYRTKLPSKYLENKLIQNCTYL